jgi:hypothetical protein
MMKAEKFVKMLKEPIKTPKDVLNYVEWQKDLSKKNKRMKKEETNKVDKKLVERTVGGICKKLKRGEFGKNEFGVNQKISTDKLWKKLLNCSDDESNEGKVLFILNLKF